MIKVKKESEVKDKSCEVNAVTGATLTSVGVSDMLQEGFAKYRKLFAGQTSQTEANDAGDGEKK